MDALKIDNRRELFTDDYLLETAGTLTRQFGVPKSEGCAIRFDAPWEGEGVTYPSVIQQGSRAYLYYRGIAAANLADFNDDSDYQVTCVAVSEDGVHFTRPVLGQMLPEYPDNNILLRGPDSHNFAPFYDTNPACEPARRWKAVAGEGGGDRKRGLRAYYSADGIHWEKPTDEPIITEGAFDSHNVAFYDAPAGLYRCYCRYWHEGSTTELFVGVRSIESSTSPDFLHWSHPTPNRYSAPLTEHFYTNATVPCPGAEHILLSFPMRFSPDRKFHSDWPVPGVSDCVFMTSRDGVNWDRTKKEAFLRGGEDPLNWGDRSQITARGLYVHEDGRVTMYIDRHYRTSSNYLEALTLRPQGFLSLHGDWDGGEAVTKPLIFGKGPLHINASTGAYGCVNLQAETPEGKPIEGFTFSDGWFGDRYDAVYPFAGDFSALAGTPIRLRIRLRDADLYAIWAEENS